MYDMHCEQDDILCLISINYFGRLGPFFKSKCLEISDEKAGISKTVAAILFPKVTPFPLDEDKRVIRNQQMLGNTDLRNLTMRHYTNFVNITFDFHTFGGEEPKDMEPKSSRFARICCDAFHIYHSSSINRCAGIRKRQRWRLVLFNCVLFSCTSNFYASMNRNNAPC